MTLASHINDLTRPHIPPGSIGGERVPSLLDQLRAAVKPTHKPGGDGSGGAPVPINPAAVDLLAHITKEARSELYEMRGISIASRAIEDIIQGLEPAKDDEWDAYLERATLEWRDRIHSLLHPRKPRRKIFLPCPSCGEKFHGEEREVCVTVNCWGDDEAMLPQEEWDARCGNCEAEWAGKEAMVWFLAAIGQGGIAA